MTKTKEQIEAFLAIRKEAAKAINPATAKVRSAYGRAFDPYGVDSELPDELRDCIGWNYFARTPGSKVWVSFDDLPASVVHELTRRIERRDPDGPSPFDDDLPSPNRLVAEIMARDDGEPGYAAAVARSIAAKLGTDAGPGAPAGEGSEVHAGRLGGVCLRLVSNTGRPADVEAGGYDE